MVCFICFQTQAPRACRILALIPSTNAISEDEEYDSSEEILLPNENNDTYESSDAPSLDSSLENLRILSDSDNNEVIKVVNISLERHVLQQSFPSPAFSNSHIQENDNSSRKQVLKNHLNLALT